MESSETDFEFGEYIASTIVARYSGYFRLTLFYSIWLMKDARLDSGLRLERLWAGE